MNVIIGRGWIHVVKGVVLTLHQVMRCQSSNGLYTINIKGDHTQGKRCYNIIQGEGIQRLNEEQIKKMEKQKKWLVRRKNQKD